MSASQDANKGQRGASVTSQGIFLIVERKKPKANFLLMSIISQNKSNVNYYKLITIVLFDPLDTPHTTESLYSFRRS